MKNLFRKIIALVSVLLAVQFTAHAQLQLNLNLIPPYSPYISDYLVYQNKTLLTVIKGTSAISQIYLRGSVTGDNGVSATTKPGFKPFAPIILTGPTTILHNTDFENTFSTNNIDVKGINVNALTIGDGLPEGNYTICITAYDFATNAQVSQPACAQIQIRYVEPPILNSPMCNSSVLSNPSQFVVFSWSQPPGAPGNAHFVLKMVELLPNQNPNNALSTITTPPFFEKEVIATTSYQYKLSDPLLTAGKTYAWQVTAFDPAKKIMFRNNGFSEVCTFIYGDAAKSNFNDTLFLNSPTCDNKISHDSLIVSGSNSLNIDWIWSKQLRKGDTSKPEPFKSANGRDIASYKIQIVPLQKQGLPAIPVKGTSDKSFTKIIPANKQFALLTPDDVNAAGLYNLHWYYVTVSALASDGTSIAHATSCNMMLITHKQASQTINVKGTLVYKLEDNGQAYGANKTSIQLGLTKDPMPSAFDASLSQANSVTITTDDSGRFSAAVPVNTLDTNLKYITMKINSSYYKQLTKNVPITIFNSPDTKKEDSLNKAGGVIDVKTVSLKQQVFLGNIVTDAYTYTLTVAVRKGFPEFYYDTSSLSFVMQHKIDSFSIAPKAKVKEGIPFVLYRKSKLSGIPYQEGDYHVEPGSHKVQNRLVVATSQTMIGKDRMGNEYTYVIFKRLLCNQKNDEYYIQADIPKPTPKKYPIIPADSNPEDDEQSLVAPEQRIVFSDKISAAKSRYYTDTTYSLISTIPPMSLVTGKIMYEWPSKPGVLAPLANASFTINADYLVDGQHTDFHLNGPCGSEMPGFLSLAKEDGGDTIGIFSNNILGVGKTDADGNFSIKIVNYDYKGVISKNGTVHPDMPLTPCDKKSSDDNKVIISNPIQTIFSKIKDWNVDDMNGLDLGNGFQIINDAGNAFDGTGKAVHGTKDVGGKVGGYGMVLPQNHFGENIAAINNSEYDRNERGGPSAPHDDDNDDNGQNTLGPTSGHTIERVLKIHITGPDMPYYTSVVDPNNHTYANDVFTVQAFDTKNLGTLVTDVWEITNNGVIKVKIKNPVKPGDTSIAGAKLVLFRFDDQPKPKKIPIGEGTVNHAYKELISNSMVAGKQIQMPKVEWVIDTGFTIQSGNSFNLGNNKLLNGNLGNYQIQISPNPILNGTIFDPVIFPYSGKNQTVEVTLADAKIIGRVLEGGTGKAIGNPIINILKRSKSKTLLAVPIADDQGYFEYQNNRGGKIDWAYNTNDSIQVVVLKEGYKPFISSWSIVPPIGKQESHDVFLEPAATATGRVVDESYNPVDAYIMRSDSTLYETFGSPLAGRFSVPVPNTANQSLRIIPKDPAYFDTSIALSILLGPNKPDAIMVPGRKHRMAFYITAINADGSKINQDKLSAHPFKVTINNDSSKSQLAFNDKLAQAALANFYFANVSVNNYTVRISDASGAGFIPQTINISNSESREPQKYTIVMKMGGVVTGTVKMGGTPIHNAHVYVEHESNTSNAGVQGNDYADMDTKTDGNGYYKLTGIPVKEGSIIIHATKDSNTVLISGSQKTVDMSSGEKTVDFTLTKITDHPLTDLWGFPITAENVSIDMKSGKLSVTGLVDLSKNKKDLDWLDNNKKVRVKNVPYQAVKRDGIVSVVPDSSLTEITTTQAAFKMKYLDKYNVELTNGNLETTPLAIKKRASGGAVASTVHIVDNSYNYPSTYLNFDTSGEFYLGSFWHNTINTTVDAITSFKQDDPNYKLCNKYGKPLGFSFIGFPATAKPDSSYIDKNGFVHLNITIKGKIPNAEPGDININIPDVILDDKKITPAKGSYPLTAKLDGWNLVVKDWTIDPKKGGIISDNAVIQTGIVDIKSKNFNLRHDLFVLDQFDFGNLTLGNGLLALEEVNKDNASLVYDLKTGSDAKPHWRFNIAGSGDVPAAVFYLDDAKTEANKLQIEYIQLISYANENIVTLKDLKTPMNIGGNDKILFWPQSISSTNGTLVLGGNGSFKVPGVPDTKLYVNYKLINGKKDMTLQPFDLQFDGKGYVKFISNKKLDPVLSNGILTFKGTVAEPGKIDTIPCTFSFGTNNPGRVDLVEGYQLSLTKNANAEPNTLKIGSRTDKNNKLINGMEVAGNSWSTLKFSGNLIGNSTLDADNSTLNFEVLGDITASSSGIKASQIPTPFGEMSLLYDFQKNTMHGAMHMNNMEFGSWLFSGDVEVNFGSEGMVVLGAGQLNTGVLLVDGFGTFSAGLVLGNYHLTDDMIHKVVQFSKDPKSSCWLQANDSGKFSGFYFTGGYDILNESKGIDLGVVAIYLDAVLGVEASIGASVGTNSYHIGVGAHGKVDAGVSAITGTEATGSLEAHLTATADVNGPPYTNFTIDGSANLEVQVNICQSYLVDKACWGTTVDAGADFTYAKGQKPNFDFYIGSGQNKFSCGEAK